MKLFSDTAKAAIESGLNLVSGAVDIVLGDGTTFRGWGGNGFLALNGNEYAGLGDDALVNASSGALGSAAQNVELSLSGVNPDVASEVDLAQLRGAPAAVHRLIFDASGTQLLDSHTFSRGRVDSAQVQETPGGASTITLQVESAAKSLGRSGGRMRTDADQRLIDANDPGFGRVSFAGGKELYWGGKTPASAGAVANGGAVSGAGSLGGMGTVNVLQPD